MQTRIIAVNQFIKTNLKATNTPDIKKEDDSDTLVEFQRIITKTISKDAELINILIKGTSEHLLPIVDELISSILAIAYKTGRCGEFCSVAFIELLKKGIQNSIEIIVTSGILYNREFGTHQVVILDHDAKQNLQNAKSLSNIIVFDCWWKYEPKIFSGDSHPTKEDLSSCYFSKVNAVATSVRYEKNLTSQDCKEIIEFLLRLQSILDYKFFLKVADASTRLFVRKKRELRAEIEEICTVISKEIDCFKLLSLNPPTAPDIEHARKSMFFNPIRVHKIGTKKPVITPPVVKFHYNAVVARVSS